MNKKIIRPIVISSLVGIIILISILACFFIIYTIGIFKLAEFDMNKLYKIFFVYIILMFSITIFLIYIAFIQNKSKDSLTKLAYIDNLTGIGNANQFFDDGNEFIRNNRHKNLAIIYFDINKFKLINDSYGYKTGNIVLKNIADIIQDMFNENAIYARSSNDNFAILYASDDNISISMRCEMLKDKISMIKTISNTPLKLMPSMGIYFINKNDVDINLCLDKAQIAKSTIKGSHTHIYAIYDETLREKLLKEREIEHEMYDALKNNEFEVYLQPKINLSNNDITGSEALVRWIHPKKGLISPMEFIPIFEKNGFIVQLDSYVFEYVCKKFKFWIDTGFPLLPISVNLSKSNVNNSEFIDQFDKLTSKYSIDPSLIEFEITESAVFDNIEILLSVIEKLKKSGFKISIDDFGSGYSSLNMLKDIPIDVLKLDRCFFNSVENTVKGKVVVSSIIDMAKKLEIRVVSEGVETTQQAEFLRNIGCDMAQGFLFAKPMTIENYEKLVNDKYSTKKY